MRNKLTTLVLALLASSLGAADLSFEAAKEGADRGDLDAVYQLGWHYMTGKSVAPDKEKAVALYQIAAKGGHPRALRNLALCYANGDGVAKNDQTAADLMQKSADLGDLKATYFLGQFMVNGTGIKRDIDRGFQLQYKAALGGLTFEIDLPQELQGDHKAWLKLQSEAQSFFKEGKLNEARLKADDAMAIGLEKLRELYWYTAASSSLLLEIDLKQNNVKKAREHYYIAEHAASNGFSELNEIPQETIIPQYLRDEAKLIIKMKVAGENNAEGLASCDELLSIVEKKFGAKSIFTTHIYKNRSGILSKMGRHEEAIAAYTTSLAIQKRLYPGDKESLMMELVGFADILNRSGKFSDEVAALQEAVSYYPDPSKADGGYTYVKSKLVRAKVHERVAKSEDFAPVDELPENARELRELADAGNPLACAKLAVKISQGTIKTLFNKAQQDLLLESKMYAEASMTPFYDFNKIQNYLDENSARRFARLGHGFAQYELSRVLERNNVTWPVLAGRTLSSEETDESQASFELLVKAADFGVPDAIHALAMVYNEGRYSSSDEWSPFMDKDGLWKKKVYLPLTKSTTIATRLTNDPFIIRKSKSAAAHYLLKDFKIGKDANSAYHLAIIYMTGAEESSRGSLLSNGIDFPAIYPDKVECASWLMACSYSKDFYSVQKEFLPKMIAELGLNETQIEQANKRAKELMDLRVRN